MEYDPERELRDVFVHGSGSSHDPRAEVRAVFPGGATELFEAAPQGWTDDQLRVGHAALVRSAKDKANAFWLWAALGVGAYFLWSWAAIPFALLVAHAIYSSVACSRRQVAIEREIKNRTAAA